MDPVGEKRARAYIVEDIPTDRARFGFIEPGRLAFTCDDLCAFILKY